MEAIKTGVPPLPNNLGNHLFHFLQLPDGRGLPNLPQMMAHESEISLCCVNKPLRFQNLPIVAAEFTYSN